MNTAHGTSRSGHGTRRGVGARAEAQPQVQRAPLRRPHDGEVRVRLQGLGSMAVGSVQAIGAHAVGFARGDRVVFPLTRDERSVLREPDRDSPDSDTLLVNADRLLGVPRDVSDEQAARILAPGLAARVLLRQLRPLKIGDRVRVNLDAGISRAVLTAWATALGVTVVEDTQPAELVLDADALREAHGIAFRHGHLQVGSADVFTAIRDGVFDDVLSAAGAAQGGQAAA